MGVWMYEDGDYGGSENYLKSALSQETTDAERVRAHKYLAFILCAERREQECRREFREALATSTPNFELTPAEQGHPSWGPVFRSVSQPPPEVDRKRSRYKTILRFAQL